MNDNDILEKLHCYGFHKWGDDEQRSIAIKILQNDIDYLSKHFDNVKNNKYFFATACAFSGNTDVIKFVFDRSTKYLPETFSIFQANT